MSELKEGLEKLMLAGIGAMALTADKTKELLDELVRRGELTFEQGKAINEELKRSVKKAAEPPKAEPPKEEAAKAPSFADWLCQLEALTPEQRATLRQRLSEIDPPTEG